MVYTPATKFPALKFFQWGTVSAPNPTLGAPLLPTDTTIRFSSAPTDHTGAIITGSFLMDIKGSDGYCMTAYIPAGGVSADGLSATIVQGIRLEGLDFTTSDTTLIPSGGFNAGDSIGCNISGVIGEIIKSANNGTIANGGTGFVIGTEPGAGGETVTIYRTTTAGVKLGFLRWYLTNGKTQYSNDGSVWVSVDDVSASVLVKASATDTTPGYLNDKLTITNGNKTITNPGANEIVNLDVKGTLASLITDVTASKDEINQALDSISANVTSANLSTLTAGVGSSADDLHTHSSVLSSSIILGENGIHTNDLLYLNKTTGKWYKVTSSAATWYNDLAVASADGDTNDSIVGVFEGVISGMSFANINPTWANAGTGTNNYVGKTSSYDCMKCWKVDNTAGAEAVITSITVSAKLQGAPAGDLILSVVLPSATDCVTPACYYDATNFTPIGAIIGSATISKLLFSGSYQNLTGTFVAPVKIPAGVAYYVVLSMNTTPHASNYYVINSGAALNGYDLSAGSGWVTPCNVTNANYTIGVTSTSPIGYSVKAYTGSDGSMGLTPTNSWSRVVGRVLSATTMYFNTKEKKGFFQKGYFNTAVSGSGYAYAVTNTCPNSLLLDLFTELTVSGSTTTYYHFIGWLRGDSTYATTFYAESISGLNVDSGIDTLGRSGLLSIDNRPVRCLRMEDGIILYNEYIFDNGSSVNNYAEFIGGNGVNTTSLYVKLVGQTT